VASLTYNAGSYGIQHRDVDFLSDTIKIMLVDSTYTPDKDDAFSTASAKEISVTGYTSGFAGSGRKTLAGKSITNDTTNDRTVFDADDPSAWTLSAGVTIGGAVVYKHLTNDAGSTPLWFIDCTDTATNGGTFTFAFAATGIAYTAQ
jgi:hypothetical protein